jgi:hypothetical protein
MSTPLVTKFVDQPTWPFEELWYVFVCHQNEDIAGEFLRRRSCEGQAIVSMVESKCRAMVDLKLLRIILDLLVKVNFLTPSKKDIIEMDVKDNLRQAEKLEKIEIERCIMSCITSLVNEKIDVIIHAMAELKLDVPNPTVVSKTSCGSHGSHDGSHGSPKVVLESKSDPITDDDADVAIRGMYDEWHRSVETKVKGTSLSSTREVSTSTLSATTTTTTTTASTAIPMISRTSPLISQSISESSVSSDSSTSSIIELLENFDVIDVMKKLQIEKSLISPASRVRNVQILIKEIETMNNRYPILESQYTTILLDLKVNALEFLIMSSLFRSIGLIGDESCIKAHQDYLERLKKIELAAAERKLKEDAECHEQEKLNSCIRHILEFTDSQLVSIREAIDKRIGPKSTVVVHNTNHRSVDDRSLYRAAYHAVIDHINQNPKSNSKSLYDAIALVSFLNNHT